MEQPKMTTAEILKELKELNKEQGMIMLKIKAHRDRIEVEPWKDSKRLLSIAMTEQETSYLYLKEAIEETQRLPPERFA